MPELPEVETVTNSVKNHIINKSFKSIEILWPKTLHNFTTADFKQKIEGKNVIDVFRRAKYIIIQFEKNLLAIHLRMTGKLYVVDSFDKNQKHISLYLQFDNKYLIYEFLHNKLPTLNQERS